MSADIDGLKLEAMKRVRGEAEAEAGPKKRRGEKEGPKALEEYCRDLCAEVRRGRIDPVSARLGVGGRGRLRLLRAASDRPPGCKGWQPAAAKGSVLKSSTIQ
jgi:ATP-dependent Clp protease ATP-binding subunit ClpC